MTNNPHNKSLNEVYVDWKTISSQIRCFNVQQCENQALHLGLVNYKHQRWSENECKVLYKLSQKCLKDNGFISTLNWISIYEHFTNRTPKACDEHYDRFIRSSKLYNMQYQSHRAMCTKWTQDMISKLNSSIGQSKINNKVNWKAVKQSFPNQSIHSLYMAVRYHNLLAINSQRLEIHNDDVYEMSKLQKSMKQMCQHYIAVDFGLVSAYMKIPLQNVKILVKRYNLVVQNPK